MRGAAVQFFWVQNRPDGAMGFSPPSERKPGAKRTGYFVMTGVRPCITFGRNHDQIIGVSDREGVVRRATREEGLPVHGYMATVCTRA